MKQIDFGNLFHRDTPRKLTYEVRAGANGDHDFVFMRSFIYDARLNIPDVRLRREHLTIPILRECNELNVPRKGLFYIARSRLSLYPVMSVKWQLDHAIVGETDLGIDQMYYDTSRYEVGDDDPYEIIIGNPEGWRMIIRMLRGIDQKVRLKDLETPYINPNIHVEIGEHCTMVTPRRRRKKPIEQTR